MVLQTHPIFSAAFVEKTILSPWVVSSYVVERLTCYGCAVHFRGFYSIPLIFSKDKHTFCAMRKAKIPYLSLALYLPLLSAHVTS